MSHSEAPAIQELVIGCGACVHLALSAGWDQMRTPQQLATLLETSETGTYNVLEACVGAGNIRVVYMSSVAVSGTVHPTSTGSSCLSCVIYLLAAMPGSKLQQDAWRHLFRGVA